MASSISEACSPSDKLLNADEIDERASPAKSVPALIIFLPKGLSAAEARSTPTPAAFVTVLKISPPEVNDLTAANPAVTVPIPAIVGVTFEIIDPNPLFLGKNELATQPTWFALIPPMPPSAFFKIPNPS